MTDDAGKLVLRLSVGVLMLLHGIHKLLHGVDGIGGMLAGMGLPTVLAYGVYLGEVVVALALAHRAELFDIGPMGGWAIELQGLFLFGSLAILLLGAGRYSVGGINGRYN